MGNYKDKFYVAKVVEIIKDTEDKLTFGLRVRVPTVHGDSVKGLRDDELPIAKPLPFPGSVMDKAAFETAVKVGTIVYVIFESGSLSAPRYFGLITGTSDYNPPEAVVDLPYATATTKGVVRVEKVGSTGYIYTSDPDPEV